MPTKPRPIPDNPLTALRKSAESSMTVVTALNPVINGKRVSDSEMMRLMGLALSENLYILRLIERVGVNVTDPLQEERNATGKINLQRLEEITRV